MIGSSWVIIGNMYIKMVNDVKRRVYFTRVCVYFVNTFIFTNGKVGCDGVCILYHVGNIIITYIVFLWIDDGLRSKYMVFPFV